MDAWKPEQLQAMILGGNARFQKFIEEQNLMSRPLAEKYGASAVAEYRRALKEASRQAAADQNSADQIAKGAAISAAPPATTQLEGSKDARLPAPSPEVRVTDPPTSESKMATAAAPQKAREAPERVDVWSDDLWA